MEGWLRAVLDYLPRWLDFQMRQFDQPGCVVAVASGGKVVLEQAFGHADAMRGVTLTPRHRFRVASHSKTFTAAGIMRLREERRLSLDDPAGRYVHGLHPAIAKATLAQILSHSAGITRDGADAGHWQDRRPFPDARELRALLAEPPTLEPGARFKYSNPGFGLAGLVIEAVTREPYGTWIAREIVARAGLRETWPDAPAGGDPRLAHGHGAKLPLGWRPIIPGDGSTRALSPATGFVSTAGDLARFYAMLDPDARRSVLSPASRREMIRRQWRDPHNSLGTHYGLGVMSGNSGDWEWYGHGGAFQGFISRTVMLPGRRLALSIVTNAIDGMAHQWSDGALHILRTFATRGRPRAGARSWSGRWWSLWGAVDLVPAGDRVLVAVPATLTPFADASEIAVSRNDRGRIVLASGFASHGEPVRRRLTRGGTASELWLGGARLLPERRLAAALGRQYGRGPRRRPAS